MSNFPLPPNYNQPKHKAPPSAIDLENVVLGALMIDIKSADEVMGILSAEVFFVEAHQYIFKAIKTLYDNKIGVDILTVSTELKRINRLAFVGGDFYLISLTQKVSSAAHIEFHSRIILQKYILRELIKTSYLTIEQSYHNDPDVFDMLNNVQKNVDRIYEVAVKEGLTEDANFITEQKKALLEKIRNKEKGISSGFLTGNDEFDEWSGGIQLTEYVVLAARPSMGKTTVGISIAKFNSFIKNKKVGFFTLEMSTIDIMNKLTAGALNIPYINIRQGKLSKTQYSKVIQYYDQIYNSNLKIKDTSTHKNYYHNIEKQIRDMVKDGVKLFLIDLVGLVKLQGSKGNETADLTQISRGFKALCNELNITIIAISQLNRKVEDRPDKTPKLADLKQSGSLEEDADVVIFLLRDAYYELQGKADLELPLRELGKTKFIVAKGRHIGVKTFISYVDMLKSKMTSFYS